MHWVKVTCVRRVDLSWSVDSVNLRGNEKLAAKGVFHMPLHNTHTIRNQQKGFVWENAGFWWLSEEGPITCKVLLSKFRFTRSDKIFWEHVAVKVW